MSELKFEYYYLGLEARVRNTNKFYTLGEAIRIAGLAARQSYVPVRVFGGLPGAKASLLGSVDASGNFSPAEPNTRLIN